jgi:putative FmdB family regulatory protein
MRYDFECEKCETRAEHVFRMADVPASVKCECGGKAIRVYGAVAIEINGGINRTSGFGESIKKRNDEATQRMRGRKAPVRTKAYDYGNGDVREV